MRVSLVLGQQRRTGAKQTLLDLGEEAMGRIRAAKNIFIKIDLGHHDIQLASTHVDAVAGVLDAVRMYSHAPVTIGDASHYSTKAALRNFGYEALANFYPGVYLVDLQDEPVSTIPIVHIDGSTYEARRPTCVQNADVRLVIAGLKTHTDYLLHGAVASWAHGTWIVSARHTSGGRLFTRAPWLYAHGPQGMHTLLAGLYQSLSPHIAIIDGTLGMEGNGPVEGRAVPMGAMLASTSALAVDAVAASLMGIESSDIGYLSLLGAERSDEITLSKIDVPLESLVAASKKFALPNINEGVM